MFKDKEKGILQTRPVNKKYSIKRIKIKLLLLSTEAVFYHRSSANIQISDTYRF